MDACRNVIASPTEDDLEVPQHQGQTAYDERKYPLITLNYEG